MIEEITGVCLIAIIAAILSMMLKKDRPEFSSLISIMAGVIILFLVLPAARSAAEMIMTISEIAGINTDYIEVIIKSCVIAMITSVSASTCRDSGNSSLAMKLEIAGRVAIIILAVPVINTLFNVILSVIK
ncbi:MAG: SpoIIIAC/SpoIIIAD family protein [Monoglobales bacterium]